MKGSGDPIVFSTATPTSSYLWRNVWPHLAGAWPDRRPGPHRDGDSDKLSVGEPDRYRFVCHSRYLDALLAALGVRRRVVLVLHDWGGGLGSTGPIRIGRRCAGGVHRNVRLPPRLVDLPESSARRCGGALPGRRAHGARRNMFIEKDVAGRHPATAQRGRNGRVPTPVLEPVIAGWRRWSGHAKCRSRASRLMSRRGIATYWSGWPPARYEAVYQRQPWGVHPGRHTRVLPVVAQPNR